MVKKIKIGIFFFYFTKFIFILMKYFLKLGLDAELAAKREAQYDPSLERQAKEYITSKTGTQINDFHGDLKSGVVLCK